MSDSFDRALIITIGCVAAILVIMAVAVVTAVGVDVARNFLDTHCIYGQYLGSRDGMVCSG